MKYTIEFTEVIAYLSQDIDADSEQDAIEKAFELMENNVIPITNSNMDYCVSTERKEEPEPEPDLPDGLQEYIDGVALNILYSNYHKSTNGIWSRAEVVYVDADEFLDSDDIVTAYYEVSIVYGCQDDTRNEEYGQTIFVHFDKTQKCWVFGHTNPEYLEEDPADRDDRLYHEEQDHIAMGIAKENTNESK